MRSLLLYCLPALLAFSSCGKKRPCTLVLLPDTQIYAEHFPEIFHAQTEWIAEHADSIDFVLHQGDITNKNSEAEWEVAREAMNLMDGKVPYTFGPGNHDIGTGGSADTRNTDLMNRYLPYEKYSSQPEFGGAFEEGKMDNTWHAFQAGGIDWLILSLEFGPRTSVLAWASGVIRDHPRHKVIINTHAYMYSDDKRISDRHGHNWAPQAYGLGKESGENAVNDGEQMWEKLVSKYPNIFMVVSGHVLNDGTGTLVSEGEHGNKVYQMLANYQMNENGGDGFLRILHIDPQERTIIVKSYSPHRDEYLSEPDQQFVFEDVEF